MLLSGWFCYCISIPRSGNTIKQRFSGGGGGGGGGGRGEGKGDLFVFPNNSEEFNDHYKFNFWIYFPWIAKLLIELERAPI